MKRLTRAVSTVHGAKVCSTVALCLAFVQVCPALVLYGSGETDDSSNNDDSGVPLPLKLSSAGVPSSYTITATVDNITAITTATTTTATGATVTDTEGDLAACYSSCRDDIHVDYKEFRKVFDISQFTLFSLLTVFMVGIYVAILKKLYWGEDREGCCGSEAARRRDSSPSLSIKEPPSHSVVLFQKREDEGAKDADAEEESARCQITGVPSSPLSAEGESSAPVSPSSLTGLCQNASAWTPAEDDPASTRHDKKTNLSVSESSDPWSPVALTRQGQGHGAAAAGHGNRLSTASFQLAKTGNRARQTTLVFLMVTSIYILSYFPYFLSILYEYLVEAGVEEPWRRWVPASLAVMKICRRSYLIANAANPLVYGLCNPYFREQLGKLLICRRDII